MILNIRFINNIISVKLNSASDEAYKVRNKPSFFYKQPVYKQLGLGWQIAK